MNEFANFIKEARKQKGFTREALAKKLDVSSSHINNMEHGLRKPSAELLAKMAKELEVSSSELLALLTQQENNESAQEAKLKEQALLGEGYWIKIPDELTRYPEDIERIKIEIEMLVQHRRLQEEQKQADGQRAKLFYFQPIVENDEEQPLWVKLNIPSLDDGRELKMQNQVGFLLEEGGVAVVRASDEFLAWYKLLSLNEFRKYWFDLTPEEEYALKATILAAYNKTTGATLTPSKFFLQEPIEERFINFATTDTFSTEEKMTAMQEKIAESSKQKQVS
jgi:transcriptional regulator with XRE-family HTH domain